MKFKLTELFRAAIMKSPNPAKVLSDAASLISDMDQLRISEADVDNPDYWAFRDRIVNIRRNESFPNDGTIFIRHSLQCDYQPGADCPNFIAVLKCIAGGNPSIEKLLWEIIGYVLSPNCKAKKFFYFYGVPNSGKSLLANVISEIVGPDSVSALNVSDFDRQFALAELCNKQVNICMDLADETLSNRAVSMIKMLTGNDTVYADRKYKSGIQYKNRAKLILGSNFPLCAKADDQALRDRAIIVPFLYSVPEEKRDLYLLEKLRTEYPGIVNRAIQAYLYLDQSNLTFTKLEPTAMSPSIAMQNISRYSLEDAIAGCFLFTENAENYIESTDAYEHYRLYCSSKGIHLESRQAFSTALGKLALEKTKKRVQGEPKNVFLGVLKG